MSNKGFTLTELLVALILMGVVVLAVSSVDITARRFFGTASEESWIQDEAKIAMGHIVKNVQLGIGDMTNSRDIGDNPNDASGCSRGFYILDGSGNLATSGTRIQVKQDDPANPNGRYDDGSDPFIEYEYTENTIRYYPDATDNSNYEELAKGIVYDTNFSFDNVIPLPNQVIATITVRRDPDKSRSLDNPETTLTSNIILRAMSTN